MPKPPSQATREAIETFRHVFDSPRHRAYAVNGGRPGALLIHGFLGTPDEMRPVADLLIEMGWTVSVPLLPGHGADLDTLFDIDRTIWLDTVRAAYGDLAATVSPCLLIGNSMGAAIAAALAPELNPTGLVLFSPFVRLPLAGPLRALAPVLEYLDIGVRPFRTIDTDNQELRQSIHELVPDLDLDDADTRATIRRLVVPARVLGRLAALGRLALSAARHISMPTLVLQGRQDDVALPANTRDFVRRFRSTMAYHQLDGGHELTRTSATSWDQVAIRIRCFATAAAERDNTND